MIRQILVEWNHTVCREQRPSNRDLLRKTGTATEFVPRDGTDLQNCFRFRGASQPIALGSSLGERVNQEIRIELNSHSESSVFYLQAADFFGGVIALEHLKKLFQSPYAPLPSFLRHSRQCIPLRDQRPSNGIGNRASVVICQLPSRGARFVVEDECGSAASHQ